jgi:hypothetical protein
MVAMVMVMVPPHHEHYPIVPFAITIQCNLRPLTILCLLVSGVS